MRKQLKFRIRKSTAFWATLLGVGTVVDLYLIRKGYFEDTLTHNGRVWTGTLPTSHPVRRWVGRGLWIAGGVWVVNHFAFGPHDNGPVHRFMVNLILEAKSDGQAER